MRRAWLARGVLPAADCYGVYAGAGRVERGGRWHLFYTGVNTAHNARHRHGLPRTVVMLATTVGIWA